MAPTKRVPTTPSTRARIHTLATLPKSPWSHYKIAKELDIPRTTVRDIAHRYNLRGHHKNMPKSGRKPLVTPRNGRSIIRSIQAHPFYTWDDFARDANISPDTVRRLAAKRHLFARIARRKVILTPKAALKRLLWAKSKRPNRLEKRDLHR